jgi:hypothetical protein
MTQEEKQLLIQDLCGRLPYSIKVHHYQGSNCILKSIDLRTYAAYVEVYDVMALKDFIQDGQRSIFEYKPYLRPMSSMTEEEEKEVRILWNEDFVDKRSIYHCYPKTTDFYNKHHLDYRGLIPMGLALDAPDGMYKKD